MTSSAVTKRQQRVCFSVVPTERASLPTVFRRTDLEHLKIIWKMRSALSSWFVVLWVHLSWIPFQPLRKALQAGKAKAA